MRSQSRAGFTLIEMMVAMTLTLIIMAILSQAFVMALNTFSLLKAIGDMQQNLRTAAVLLKSDLGNAHFEGDRRLSDANFATGNPPPQAGFFVVQQASAPTAAVGAPYLDEGFDSIGMNSYRASDQLLYCTVRRAGNRQENYFNAVLPGPAPILGAFFAKNTAYNIPSGALMDHTIAVPYTPGAPTGFYTSHWSEVLYFLVPTGITSDPSIAGAYPTYSLYRAQFVMPPDSTPINTAPQIPSAAINTFVGMACNPTASGVTFYSPQDAAAGNRTINIAPFNNGDLRLAIGAASTLVLPNVLSFQVKIMRSTDTVFIDPASFGGVYDTTRFNTAGYNAAMNSGLKAIQITMRVWDNNTRQTRQVTVTQDL